MNGLHELPLIIFTVLAQRVVGAWLFFAIALWQSKSTQSQQWLYRRQFVLLALLGIGFVASVLHLGSPLRAFNSLNRVGQSMLSNEIASGAVFFAVAGLFWLLAIWGKLSQGLTKTGLILTALLGLLFMWFMANLYQIPTVPTWHNSLTSWQFYLTVLVGGSALAYAFLATNPQQDYCVKALPWLHAAGVLLIGIVLVYQGFKILEIQSSIQAAKDLVPDFASLSALRLLCLGVATALLLKSRQSFWLYFAALLTIFAEFIGRSLFYALHMTQGMAIGG